MKLDIAKEIFLDNYNDIILADKFSLIIKFLKDNPNYISSRNSKMSLSDLSDIKKLAKKFYEGRLNKAPSIPETIPDPLIKIVLSSYYNITDEEKLNNAEKLHAYSMSAENIIGDLLERYIASKAEDKNWVWCTGNIVRAVDFIKFNSDTSSWSLLQIKNRDNSENSSSAAVRDGTNIQKWFRTFSRKKATNWENFPDESLKSLFRENDFQNFVHKYLKKLI